MSFYLETKHVCQILLEHVQIYVGILYICSDYCIVTYIVNYLLRHVNRCFMLNNVRNSVKFKIIGDWSDK